MASAGIIGSLSDESSGKSDSGWAISARSINVSNAEYAARADRLCEYLVDQRLSGVVLFESTYILYLTGFSFIPSGRPIAFVMDRDGARAMFVPWIEAEHARQETGFERIEHYAEYPQHPHPMEVLKGVLDDMGIVGRFGVDSDGYPWMFGYHGPALSDLTGGACVRVSGFIENLMAIKGDAEIGLIRESCKWGSLAHSLLQQYTASGKAEIEVSARASNEATLAMLDTLGDRYRAHSTFFSGAFAGYRGQSRHNASNPHALPNNLVFQEGDVLVTGAGAPMWGYYSELERTMFVGHATEEQRTMFEHMTVAQEVAFNVLRPGKRCSDVDHAVRSYFEQHDLMRYWKHHTGRAVGLRYYESPFLDIADDTEIKPGMVFAVEPGLYASHLGGFRHSDTVLVTENGIELLTCYPRDLKSLTIPV